MVSYIEKTILDTEREVYEVSLFINTLRRFIIFGLKYPTLQLHFQ